MSGTRSHLTHYACPACRYHRFEIQFDPREGYAEIRCWDCHALIVTIPAERLEGVTLP